MGIKLVAFDLDGTLLKNDKTLSKRVREVLYRAAGQGIYLVPATGRIYDGFPEEIRSLPFIRYAITSNGAEVYDVQGKKALYTAELEKEDVRRLCSYMDQLPAIYGCYQKGKGFIDKRFYGIMKEYAEIPYLYESMKSVYSPLENFTEAIFQTGATTVQKLQMYFADLKERQRVLEEMPRIFPEFEITTSLANNIEINAAEATKGAALQFLCRYLGLESRESMAFGDGTNDLAMLRAAGLGVAMANAAPEVKAAADAETGSNEEDGVAIFLERYL